jgi:hypothetical protein
MEFLNPYSKVVRESEKKAHEEGAKKRKAALDAKRGISKSLSKDQKANLKKLKKASQKWIESFNKSIDDNVARDLEREREEHEAEP